MMKTKQVIVIRKDLKMRTGKAVAQGAHASMKAIMELCERKDNTLTLNLNEQLNSWLGGIFTKICVYVNSEEELLNIYNVAKEQSVICSLVRDNGQTEFHSIPTYTAVAVGPDSEEVINLITGHLPLL